MEICVALVSGRITMASSRPQRVWTTSQSIPTSYVYTPVKTKTLARVTRGPALTAQFAELIQRGWTQNELGNLAGGNLLRVMAEMESISHRMRKDGRKPSMAKYDKRRDLDPHKMPF